MSSTSLFKKYDVPVPRYTSYPTVPYWKETPTVEIWTEHLNQALSKEDCTWSMYIHIPYCESLCTFCGCNTIITKNHNLEKNYVDLILKEWKIYLDKSPELINKPLKHLHLGGGTPTFLSSASLEALLKPLLSVLKKDIHFEASIEVDPRKTSEEQLQTLKNLGFDRVSMGVQDFNPEVQRLINRIQPFDMTKKLTDYAREINYKSVNFDLIYGLAKQTEDSFKWTIEKTLELRPDRIALYSFALVPWIKPAQRLFKDEDLPVADEKRKLYELARTLLIKNGYIEIGMDHFALPDENLSLSLKSKNLHRNFMGYTDQKTDILLGLGVSAISETPFSFHQNEKVFQIYENSISKNNLATHRGHILSMTDIKRRQQILQLMTQYEVQLESNHQLEQAQVYLQEMINDNLVVIDQNRIKMTSAGKPFLRNVCSFFDEHLQAHKPETKIFSQSI